MPHRLRITGERLKAILVRNGPAARARKRAINKLADKLGFVYFGFVDQHSDEHHVVRGFSRSSTHKDESYAVGTIEDYSVSFVDRFDMKVHENGDIDKHNWFIVEFDLKNGKDLPHFFLVPTHQSSLHYQETFSTLRSIELTPLVEGLSEFHNRYTLHSSPAHLIDMESIFDRNVAQSIAAHFWPLAVEVFEGSLYVYSAEKKLTQHILETVIKNGTWLAQVLDKKSEKSEA